MRDIKRIEPLLETVRKIWLERPDYRLMQLFGNVYRGDPYHMEDDELLQRLESTYLPERDACINAEIPVALEGEISISKVKDLVRKVSDLQAQLRQVEEALQERKEFIADCDTALDRIQAPRTNEGQEELVSTWRRIELLGKLLYQYRQELERSAPALRAENAWQRCGTCALSEGVYEDICTQKESCVNSAQPTATANTGFLMSMRLAVRSWCCKGR